MQTDLRRTTMEVFLSVCLVLSESVLLAFGLFTIYTSIQSFWICFCIIIVSELLTQIISLVLLNKKTLWSIVCHILQIGIYYRIVKLLVVEKQKFDIETRTIHRLRLLRALTANLSLVFAIGLLILRQKCTYIHWIPLIGILLITTITVSYLTSTTSFFLALFWRLCELTFRMTSLLVLALAYGWWSSMALVLHWTAMFLWCFTHDLLKTQRKHDSLTTILINFRSSLILCFFYVDVRRMTSLKRTIAYYVIIFVENWILYAAWLLQSGLNSGTFIHVTVTMVTTSVLLLAFVAVHCFVKQKTKVRKMPAQTTQTQTIQHQYARRQNQTNGLTPIAECDIYEELSDSPRSDETGGSGNTSPSSHTRLVPVTSQSLTSQSVTSPITVYTIAGHKFKVVDGAIEGVQYSTDVQPSRSRDNARPPLPKQPHSLDSDSPYAITQIVEGEGHHRPSRRRSWSGKRPERSLSPEYETCGPGSDSIYSSIPQSFLQPKTRPKLPRHHRHSSSSSGYDVTESDQSFSSPSPPPQTLERDGVTSLTEIMDNLSKDSAISMTDERLRVTATGGKTFTRSRMPVDSSVCTGANSIFGESEFERSEYNSTLSGPDRRRIEAISSRQNDVQQRIAPSSLTFNKPVDCLQSTSV